MVLGVFTPKTIAMFPQAFGEIDRLANVKRTVSGLKDVDPSKTGNRKRRGNIRKYFAHGVDFGPLSFIAPHVTIQFRKHESPSTSSGAFDATLATKWPAMSKARASRGPRRMAARRGFEPRLGESKSPVLPLHHQAVMEGRKKPPVPHGSRVEMIIPQIPGTALNSFPFAVLSQ